MNTFKEILFVYFSGRQTLSTKKSHQNDYKNKFHKSTGSEPIHFKRVYSRSNIFKRLLWIHRSKTEYSYTHARGTHAHTDTHTHTHTHNSARSLARIAINKNDNVNNSNQHTSTLTTIPCRSLFFISHCSVPDDRPLATSHSSLPKMVLAAELLPAPVLPISTRRISRSGNLAGMTINYAQNISETRCNFQGDNNLKKGFSIK